MRPMRVLSRVVREFAAGVDAGNAVRLGLPVRGDALANGAARDAAAAPAVASGCRRIAPNRTRA